MSTSTDINLILDASGSMMGLIDDTVGGVNNFIEEQKKLPDPAFVTLTTFDTQVQQRYLATPLAEVPALTRDTYYGGHGGNTALIDAVGKAISNYEALPVKADKAIFFIVTDGQENSSYECNLAEVRASIDRLQKAGYAFIFLGANDSAWQADRFGVSVGTTGVYTATATGTAAMYKNAASNSTRMRASDLSAHASGQSMGWNTGEGEPSDNQPPKPPRPTKPNPLYPPPKKPTSRGSR
jgi:uncharacterized protein YegL